MTRNSAQLFSLSNVMNAERAHSHSVALCEHKTWSWLEFQSDVAELTLQLRDYEHQNIALCATDTYLFAIGFLPFANAKKTIVLPGNYQPKALLELSNHYELLLCDSDIASSIRHTGDAESPHLASIVLIENSSNRRLSTDAFTFDQLDLESQSVVLYTSGSSGQPKAIDKTLLQLDVEISVLEAQWGEVLLDSSVQSTVSHQHIYGLLFKLLWPLCAGRAFHNTTLEFPEQLTTQCNEDTLLISSPALLKRLSDQASAHCRMVFSSGGPLPYKAAQASYQLLGHHPMEVFGSTETGGIAFRQQRSEETPWTLFPAIKAELNSEGCLRLLSPYIDASQWYQTADQCELHNKSLFTLKGRADRIVKIEEKRISLVEVEKRLEQLPWIEESAVIPMQDNERLTLVSALVLTTTGKAKMGILGKGKFWLLLRSELRQWLEPIAVPKRYRVVDEIPLTSQGKRLTASIEQLFEIQPL